MTRAALPAECRRRAVQPRWPRVRRPPRRPAERGRSGRRLATAAGRHRSGRGPARGRAARTGGGDRHRPRRDHRRASRVADLRPAAGTGRRGAAAGAIAARRSAGSRCASPARTATSGWTPIRIRNSMPGAGRSWRSCRRWRWTSSGRSTGCWRSHSPVSPRRDASSSACAPLLRPPVVRLLGRGARRGARGSAWPPRLPPAARGASSSDGG